MTTLGVSLRDITWRRMPERPIGNSGNAKVENSGDVTVTGRRGVGLGVDTYGTGNAEVEMTGGSVKAGTK